MLKLHIYAGTRKTAVLSKPLAVLDIGYLTKGVIASYVTALRVSGHGYFGGVTLDNYPRWSAPRWDLVARCLCRCLFLRDYPLPVGAPAKRPAFVDNLFGLLEEWDEDGTGGREAGWLELTRVPKSRCGYTAVFQENSLPKVRVAAFPYGPEALNPADLVLRAICQGLFKCDGPAEKPRAWIPDLYAQDGGEHLRLSDVPEPARSEMVRHLNLPWHGRLAVASAPPTLVPVEQAIAFLESA